MTLAADLDLVSLVWSRQIQPNEKHFESMINLLTLLRVVKSIPGTLTCVKFHPGTEAPNQTKQLLRDKVSTVLRH